MKMNYIRMNTFQHHLRRYLAFRPHLAPQPVSYEEAKEMREKLDKKKTQDQSAEIALLDFVFIPNLVLLGRTDTFAGDFNLTFYQVMNHTRPAGHKNATGKRQQQWLTSGLARCIKSPNRSEDESHYTCRSLVLFSYIGLSRTENPFNSMKRRLYFFSRLAVQKNRPNPFPS